MNESIIQEVGDEVALRESPHHNGRLSAVAMHGGVEVCWNCFEPLSPGVFLDAPAKQTFIRICRSPQCHKDLLRELRRDIASVQ